MSVDQKTTDNTAAILSRIYKNETLGICLIGAIVTFLIMLALSGVLYTIT
jgi:hypothetical protein